jgi:23S rRNA (uracil1939-C5)-methyltransferase
MKKTGKFQKNDCVTVTIEDIGSDGEGIGKVDGYPLFVKDGIIGDQLAVRVVKDKKGYAYARLEEILVPSPYRVEAPCPIHRQCGGCQLQALSYERQLQFKEEKVKGHLVRIGKIDRELVEAVTETIVGMEEPYRYRNKAIYPVGEKKRTDGASGVLADSSSGTRDISCWKPIVGFYAGHTHSIVENTDCLLGDRENSAILKAVLDYMEECGIRAYDETTGKGYLRHVLIRSGVMGRESAYSPFEFECRQTPAAVKKEFLVCLVVNKQFKKSDNSKNEGYLSNQENLIDKLAKIEGVTSVSVNYNTEFGNRIIGENTVCIWGSAQIYSCLRVRNCNEAGYPFIGEKFQFAISPSSFYQVNTVQTEKLYSLVIEFAQLTGKEIIWDLYCGIGTISIFLARHAGKVYGVEINPQAIDDAKENAKINQIQNAEFFTGKAEEVLPKFYQEKGITADLIVVDPPRKGCDEACLDTMVQMKPKKVIYVSCDSATLARDLKILMAGGYEVKRVRAVDLFPHTVHVETVVLLERK